MRVKSKVLKVVVRPALIYELEAAPLNNIDEQKIYLVEMKMLRWIVGVTKSNRIRNKNIKGKVKVVEVSKKIQESKFRWYGHLRRREHEGRMVMEMEVQEIRKKNMIQTQKNTLHKRKMNFNLERARNRNTWRKIIHKGDSE